MKIKYLITLLLIAFSLLFSTASSVLRFIDHRDSLMNGIDDKLYTAALMARAALPGNYHDIIVDSSSVSKEEFSKIVDKNNKLCVNLNMEYFWSLMKIDGDVVFTSSTSPDKIVENNKHAMFFDVHSNPKAYTNAFSTNNPQYQINDDKWGRIKVVLLPFKDNNGRQYLFGASIKLSEVDAQLNKNIRESIYLGLGFLFIGFIFSFILSKLLSEPFIHLASEASEIASGRFDKKIKEAGLFEQVELAQSFNRMSLAIKEQISALQESEKKYRSMMDAIDAPVYINSSEYIIEYINPTMIKRVGSDAVGRHCYKVIHGLEDICNWCRFKTLNPNKAQDYEIVSPKDGRTYHASNSLIIHEDKSASKLTILRDNTDYKKLETQLQQAQKMESIGTLAGGIAHDFNNILFPIFGYLELAMESIQDNPQLLDQLNKVFNGAQRARDLVKQILTFSRQTEQELKPLEIKLIIKEALKLLRSSIPSTIEINQNISDDCGLVMADHTHIHQIIMNLCTNAFHSMEETGGKLTVTLEEVNLSMDELKTPVMNPGQYLCLKVSDTGSGMEQKLIDRIFDPYFTTKTVGKGTGLGLAVIHGIVKNYNGHIDVYSEPGKGTEFKVYFPVIQSNKVIEKPKADLPIQKGNEHILLVDDQEVIIQMLRTMLEKLGYQVTIRTSSIEALALFRVKSDSFDLVLTDMTMPNMTGDELAGEMIKLRSDIPILLCTGFSETISEEKAAELGIKGFLLKPILMKNLSSKIREVLDNKDQDQ